ncbi:hypothetical protein LX81_02888 [Palleronia aestuarii]|uniref:Uncharacterized protein n=1 Tax=Palleronia aestuarii TaxID=568105 RepID=A0A2W7N1M7_9RHOB|nr:hypothetical protein LX81_02888 [Palleronia aestuarii]
MIGADMAREIRMLTALPSENWAVLNWNSGYAGPDPANSSKLSANFRAHS